MKCIICHSDSNYFLSKTFTESPFDELMQEIGKVEYFKCSYCGFVLSKTISELEAAKWNSLNLFFHHYMENPDNKMEINQPPYAEQAMMLSFLGINGVINTDIMIDYASGYGSLSNILAKYQNIELSKYDPYVQGQDLGNYLKKSDLSFYQTVINSAMFEHITKREDLERVNNLVDVDGCLIIHTLICENVPNDPDWFYFRPPVHTAFHTNKSMEILLEQWGYRSSLYCPKSKCWVLLKDNIQKFEKKVATINQELQSNWFYCKNGFVDYWKGF